MQKKRIKILLNIIAIVFFIVIVSFITSKYAPQLIAISKDPQKFRNWVLSFGSKSILMFVLFQIIQVIISVIPGEVVQISGGYIYGTILGSLFSLIGITIGSIVVFYISRLLGYNLIKEIVSEQKLKSFYFLINSSRSEIAIFLLFLIPGIPKDILTYIVGLSPIKPLRFFILVTIARFPGIFFSSYIGSNIQEKNYGIAIVVGIIATILFLLGVIFRTKIIDYISSSVNKKR